MSRPIRVFVTYTHDSEEHKSQVLALATFLRGHGLDVRLDAWDSNERRDWYEWGQRQIRLADYVLAVASPRYRMVGDGDVPAHRNRGAQAEIAALREMLQNNRPEWIRRVLPVLLPGRTPADIPLFLQPYTADRYPVEDLTLAGTDSLVRVLTRQPAAVAPPIGTVPSLGPVSTATDRPLGPRPGERVQINTAYTGGTVFSVQDGDLHVSRPSGPEPG